MRAFLDANVLFSAAYGAGSTAWQLWKLQQKGLVRLVTSPLAIAQATRYLGEKRPESLPELAALLAYVEIGPDVGESDPARRLDKEDGVLLATAIAVGSTHFVTGDKHFLPLRQRGSLGIRIATIREVLATTEGEERDAG